MIATDCWCHCQTRYFSARQPKPRPEEDLATFYVLCRRTYWRGGGVFGCFFVACVGWWGGGVGEKKKEKRGRKKSPATTTDGKERDGAGTSSARLDEMGGAWSGGSKGLMKRGSIELGGEHGSAR